MAGTSRLFLRFTNEEEPSREQVLKIIAIKYEVPVLGIRKLNSGYNILFKRKSDTDKILEYAATEVLRRINLSVKIPPEIKARRSLFCREIDLSVGEHSPEEIKNELQHKQPWLKIREIIKFKTYTHVFKIECDSVSMADRVMQSGLKCFYTIPTSQIEREKFINLLM